VRLENNSAYVHVVLRLVLVLCLAVQPAGLALEGELLQLPSFENRQNEAMQVVMQLMQPQPMCLQN
jgi:hypothetical protein